MSTPRKQKPTATDEWDGAASANTIASVARLEAVANVEAKKNASADQAADGNEQLVDHCRIAYSSVLNVTSAREAQELLARVFTQALTNNPRQGIGGILFYDEQTSALVQVLEGPSSAVRALFHEKIKLDPRHTSVKLLWDVAAETRQYESFGMQLGSDPEAVLQKDPPELLQLTYVSQLTAASPSAAYKDMEAILGVAIVTNPRLGIGGALFLNPRTFQVLQALEGPESNVRALYNKIAADKRHTACEVMSELTVTERTYEQWGMLQGDLKDWSSLASGRMSLNGASRRRGRRAREDFDEAATDDKFGTTPSQAQALKGELQTTSAGPAIAIIAGEA